MRTNYYSIKTIYLACNTLECLIEDIRRAFPDYAGEIEYSHETGALHLIGDIPTEFDKEGLPTAWVGQQHANVYVPDGFNESIFKTIRPAPKSPVNKLAL